jgi:hypothetical protein
MSFHQAPCKSRIGSKGAVSQLSATRSLTPGSPAAYMVQDELDSVSASLS